MCPSWLAAARRRPEPRKATAVGHEPSKASWYRNVARAGVNAGTGPSQNIPDPAARVAGTASEPRPRRRAAVVGPLYASTSEACVDTSALGGRDGGW